jgi:hypothetical protein
MSWRRSDSIFTDGNGTDMDLGCSFTGCAIGWKDMFIPDSPLKLDDDCVPSFEGETSWAAIRAAYGLYTHQAYYLFNSDSYLRGTALDVAKRIESVLADGFPGRNMTTQR